jgi:hypothetical protein
VEIVSLGIGRGGTELMRWLLLLEIPGFKWGGHDQAFGDVKRYWSLMALITRRGIGIGDNFRRHWIVWQPIFSIDFTRWLRL